MSKMSYGFWVKLAIGTAVVLSGGAALFICLMIWSTH